MEGTLQNACLFEILERSDQELRRVLPKASVRLLARLVVAYPRAVGRSFMEVLSSCLSPAALEFLREEVNHTQIPTFGQIREAEASLFQLIEEEFTHPETLPNPVLQ